MEYQLSEFGTSMVMMLMFGFLAICSAVMVKAYTRPPIGWYINLWVGFLGIAATAVYGFFRIGGG